MRIFVGVVLLLLVQLGFAAKLYKWVDDEGNVQYSQTPPPPEQQQKAETVYVNNGPAPKPKAEAPAAANAAENATPPKENLTAEQARQKNCEIVTNNFEFLKQNAKVSMQDSETQKKRTLSVEEHQAELEKAHALVAEHCSPPAANQSESK